MKKSILVVAVLSIIVVFNYTQSKSSKNSSGQSTPKEWITLFNGENLEGWEMYGPEPFTRHWSVVDGAIACNNGIGEKNIGFFRSIMTTRDFGDFELELEYKIAKGGNSGIFYHVVESPDWEHDYMTGPEYQLLDDEFSRSETAPFKMLASNYAMYAPAENKKVNPYMQWNQVKIIYHNGHVEHWLNGKKVLTFKEGSEDWKNRKSKDKWANQDSYAAYKKGRISLQNHGDEVHFKNIRIREL